MSEYLASLTSAPLASVRLVAADIDDTLTQAGKFTGELLAALSQLAQAGLHTLLVTGRSAGWGQALAAYLPGISGVIAENGLVWLAPGAEPLPLGVFDSAPLADNTARLAACYGWQPAEDNAFRLYDRTFLRPPDFDQRQLARCRQQVDAGFEVLASSVHIHVKPAGYSKSTALLQVANTVCAVHDPAQEVLVIGDSPNDAPLFRVFPLAVGVANVLDYRDELGADLPRFVTRYREGAGFLELTERLLARPRHDL